MVKQLVIQLARFGDILQTKRLLLSLRRRGETHLCVDKSMLELARLIYPDMPIHGLPAHGGSASGVLTEGRAVLESLRTEGFDAVYALNHAGLCRAVAAMFDPCIVRGYPVAAGQPLRSNWMRLAFRWMADRAAAPLNLVDFWAALAPDMIAPELVNPAANGSGEGLGVVMAGQNARRSLPAELLAPIVHAVFERLGGPRVRLLGGPGEQGAARKLFAKLPAAVAEKCTDLTGKTDWRGLADAVAGLDCLLSPDTGTAHLAAHLGTPVEGLYCSSAWAFETGPYGLGHKVWQTCTDCAPCVESAPCPREAACRAYYAQPQFLARMQGKTSGAAVRPLRDMLPLQSQFDAMGEIWTPVAKENGDENADPRAEARAAMRAALAEYRGISLAAQPAYTLYQEADWMLPQIRP